MDLLISQHSVCLSRACGAIGKTCGIVSIQYCLYEFLSRLDVNLNKVKCYHLRRLESVYFIESIPLLLGSVQDVHDPLIFNFRIKWIENDLA